MGPGTTDADPDADAKPRFLLVWPDGGFFRGWGGGGVGPTPKFRQKKFRVMKWRPDRKS